MMLEVIIITILINLLMLKAYFFISHTDIYFYNIDLKAIVEVRGVQTNLILEVAVILNHSYSLKINDLTDLNTSKHCSYNYLAIFI